MRPGGSLGAVGGANSAAKGPAGFDVRGGAAAARGAAGDVRGRLASDSAGGPAPVHRTVLREKAASLGSPPPTLAPVTTCAHKATTAASGALPQPNWARSQ